MFSRYEIVRTISGIDFTLGAYPFKWMAEMRCRSINQYRYGLKYKVRKIEKVK